MAITRKALKAMGIEEEKVDQIIEMHIEVTDSLKAERDKYKSDSEKLADVQKELDTLKAQGDGGFKAKYEAEKSAHDALKQQIADEQAKQAKEAAVRAFYESKNITDKNLKIAMRGTDFSKIEMDGEKIKDTKALEDLVAGDYASLVSTTSKEGANTGKPPVTHGGTVMSKEDIMKIQDRTERRKQIAEHMDLFTEKEN